MLLASNPAPAQPASPAASADGMSGYECPPDWRRRPDPPVRGQRFSCYGKVAIPLDGRQCPDGMQLMRSKGDLHFTCQPPDFGSPTPAQTARDPAPTGRPGPRPASPPPRPTGP